MILCLKVRLLACAHGCNLSISLSIAHITAGSQQYEVTLQKRSACSIYVTSISNRSVSHFSSRFTYYICVFRREEWKAIEGSGGKSTAVTMLVIPVYCNDNDLCSVKWRIVNQRI